MPAPGDWLPLGRPPEHHQPRLRVFWVGPCPWCRGKAFVAHIPLDADDSTPLKVADPVLLGDRIMVVARLLPDGRAEVQDPFSGDSASEPRVELVVTVPYGLHASPECGRFMREFVKQGTLQIAKWPVA